MTNKIVKSTIKEEIQNKDMYCSAEVFDALEEEISALLSRACKRAEANKRKTVYGKDL